MKMNRRQGWDTFLIWFGIILALAVFWLACIGGGWLVIR